VTKQTELVRRRYTIGVRDYSTDGHITRVAGQPEIALDEFLLPMALASDALVSDGELIGDPSEGALVTVAVLAAPIRPEGSLVFPRTGRGRQPCASARPAASGSAAWTCRPPMSAAGLVRS
jgi:hypothetical protein